MAGQTLTKNKPPVGCRINFGHPLARNLVSCWLMAEGAGLKAIDSVGLNNGAIVGALWQSVRGKSLNFTGTNVINLGNLDIFMQENKPLSIYSIIYPTAASNGGGDPRIMCRNSGSADGVQFVISDAGAGAASIDFKIAGSTALNVRSSGNSITLNAWQSVGVTWNGTTSASGVSLFVNGVNLSGRSLNVDGASLTDSSAWSTFIGNRSDSTRALLGNMVCLYYYNRGLTPAEMQHLHEAPFAFVQTPRNRVFGTTTQYASPTGPKSPATAVDDNSNAGNVAWTNPSNAKANDNIYATSILLAGQVTDYLKVTDFGFHIPTTHGIDGIKVEIERKSGLTSNAADTEVKLVKGGTVGGSNLASGTNWPTSEAYTTYGGASNLWGTTWTAANINATNFGVVLSASATLGDTLSVDHIRVTVYHSIPVSAVTTGIFTPRSGYWGDL